ncbi:porphobilinogen deaminase [Clostridium sp. CAG:1013]|nr:porphobilinogen deaminase [Clostridium sp. CAG:1013]
MKHIRIGSRESRLAVIQSEIVINAIHQWDPTIQTELVTMKTTGDVILDRTLDKIGGKGLFVKELDAALLDGRVDLTVHSSKDLPMETDPRLPLVAFSKRADPRDVLVLPENKDTIDFTKPIGCSSLRRQLQLRALFPEATVAPVRGNVLTRLQKLDSGEFSALVLAGAGLARLGLERRISRYFSVEEILPAAGQGILAVQTQEGVDTSCLGGFADEDGRDCLLAERAFVRTLDGGCSSPVAAFATVERDTLTLKGMYVTPEETLYFETISGPRDQGEALGAALAEEMRRKYQ